MNELQPLVDAFAALPPWRGTPADGCVPNFLGVMTARAFLEQHSPSNNDLRAAATGEALPPTVADGEAFFEFAAIHKAVREAHGSFTMVELGGGFAARSVDAHAALMRWNPMPCRLVVVEAEPTHFRWAEQHMRANGIDPAAHWLVPAAVAAKAGPSLFLMGEGAYFNTLLTAEYATWFLKQIPTPEDAQAVLGHLLLTGTSGVTIPYQARNGNRYEMGLGMVSALPLQTVLAPLDRIDLMDIDIQGSEATALPPAIDLLNARVRRIHLGTHGPEIHSALWDLFFENEWAIELDYPRTTDVTTPWGSFTTSDGILHASNPRLAR